MLQCEMCGAVFPDSLERCPNCESSRLVGYEMENPFSRLPMESILRVTGHIIWLIGLVGCLIFLWNTDKEDETLNMLLALGGFIFLCISLVFSITLFGMGEILRRLIRVQRRVRAFSEGYHVATAKKPKSKEPAKTEEEAKPEPSSESPVAP